MAKIEQEIARHYTHGGLAGAIERGLEVLGLADVTLDDLAAIDEFHMGGREATAELAERLGLGPGSAALDIGCGLGGAARFLAKRYGCNVIGIDLTEEYVTVAAALTERVGLAEQVLFQVASALDLPFADGGFDAATLLHVGMNIEDKARLCAEAHRVLRPGGVFAVYDVMRVGDGDPDYPTPWATTKATCFVAEPHAYRQALSAAGFEVESERSRADLALRFFERMRARMAVSGPPPLGLHILMGDDAPAKVANVVSALESGRIAPVEMIARRR